MLLFIYEIASEIPPIEGSPSKERNDSLINRHQTTPLVSSIQREFKIHPPPPPPPPSLSSSFFSISSLTNTFKFVQPLREKSFRRSVRGQNERKRKKKKTESLINTKFSYINTFLFLTSTCENYSSSVSTFNELSFSPFRTTVVVELIFQMKNDAATFFLFMIMVELLNSKGRKREGEKENSLSPFKR